MLTELICGFFLQVDFTLTTGVFLRASNVVSIKLASLIIIFVWESTTCLANSPIMIQAKSLQYESLTYYESLLILLQRHMPHRKL